MVVPNMSPPATDAAADALVSADDPPTPTQAPTQADVLAYAADIAVELSITCARSGFDAVGAHFLAAAAEARRQRARLSGSHAWPPNAAPPDAT